MKPSFLHDVSNLLIFYTHIQLTDTFFCNYFLSHFFHDCPYSLSCFELVNIVIFVSAYPRCRGLLRSTFAQQVPRYRVMQSDGNSFRIDTFREAITSEHLTFKISYLSVFVSSKSYFWLRACSNVLFIN